MPEEETSQETLEETSAEGESEETSTEGESTQATEESQEDLKAEIERLRKTEQDYKSLEREYQTTSQERAQYKAYIEQQQRQQQQQDPAMQLRKQMEEAYATGDPSFLSLQDQYLAQRENQVTMKAAQAALQAAQVQQGLGSAAETAGGNFSLEDFQNIQRGMTPEEAAIVKRHREGTLSELYKNEQKQQRQERSAAARATQSGATSRARGPKAGAPIDESSLEEFNIKVLQNYGNKKAQRAYLKRCEPGSIHPDIVAEFGLSGG